MPSLCAGKCPICGCGGFCLAGNGDDDFYLASKEDLIYRLQWNEYPDCTRLMIRTLEEEYNHTFDERDIGGMQGPKQPTFWPLPTNEELQAIWDLGVISVKESIAKLQDIVKGCRGKRRNDHE